MGKEWYWAGKSSKKTSSTTTTEEETQHQTPSGCMCAVFHFFDFHPFHFPSTLNHHQQQQTPFKSTSQDNNLNTIIPKGVEAPRNSLESKDGSTTISSLSKEDNFKIPKNIQIKTRRERNGNLNEFSSEMSSNSPGIKTPTLVARLMGLDLLPDSESPSFSTPKQYIQTKHRNSIDSSEITRISSARKSDVVVDHHRLSLQINKEINVSEEFEVPRFSFSKKKFDENNNVRSPSHYAKQIVKQVKESVSRKVGQDITNTTTREEFSTQIRVKKCSKTTSLKKSLDESNSSSCSPKLRFIDTKQKPTTLKDQNTLPNVVKVKLPSQPFSAPKVSRVVTKTKDYGLVEEKKLVTKCKKKNTNEKFSSRFKRPPQTIDVIRNKQEETFIIKSGKSKKTHQPLSSNLLNNINTVPNLLIPQKQSQESNTQDSKHCSQLSSCSSQRYKQEEETTLANQDNLNRGTSSTTTGGGASHSQLHKPEFQYITKILNRTKIAKTNTTTTTLFFNNQWFSPKHPLDPSIFHYLEHQFFDKDRNFITKNQLGHRWNRRLMFDLVDDVLKEILKPSEKKLSFLFCKEWSVEELIGRVWKRVEEFPCAKCEVLEDIDLLIENEDMEKAKTENEGEEERERESLVTEIEGKVFDMLVHETVMVMDCFRKTK